MASASESSETGPDWSTTPAMSSEEAYTYTKRLLDIWNGNISLIHPDTKITIGGDPTHWSESYLLEVMPDDEFKAFMRYVANYHGSFGFMGGCWYQDQRRFSYGWMKAWMQDRLKLGFGPSPEFIEYPTR